MVAGYTRAKDEKNEAGVGIDIMRIDRSGVDAEGLQDVLIEQVRLILGGTSSPSIRGRSLSSISFIPSNSLHSARHST